MFKKKDKLVDLITDAKISKLKFREFNVTYVIRLDKWWNPI